jgi:hypothetical protein
MATPTNPKTEEYRGAAAACLDLAERMTDSSDRARMLQMAQDWLDLAMKAEKDGADLAS